MASTDTTVYDTAETTEKPLAHGGPKLYYPGLLRQAEIEGTVVLSLVVNADGRVDPSSIHVISTANPGFNDEAKRWARGSLFWPGCREGRPVRVRMVQPVDFFFRRRE